MISILIHIFRIFSASPCSKGPVPSHSRVPRCPSRSPPPRSPHRRHRAPSRPAGRHQSHPWNICQRSRALEIHKKRRKNIITSSKSECSSNLSQINYKANLTSILERKILEEKTAKKETVWPSLDIGASKKILYFELSPP